MPLPLLLAAAAAPAIAKGALGLYQMFQHVDRKDSTTPEDREILAAARQRQAGQLPNLAQMQGRLAQAQGAAVQNATVGSGGAGDYLASVSAADRVRSNGEQQLGVLGEQYHERATAALTQQLAATAARSRADTQRAEQANAQLKGAGLNNLSNALSEGSSVAAYGLSGAGGAGVAGAGEVGTPQVAPALLNTPYGSGDYYGRSNPYLRARSQSMYGGYPVG